MARKTFIRILFTLFLCFTALTTVTVSAKNYGTLTSREVQNQQMYNSAASLSSVSRARYTDKYLKDLYATNYKSLTTTQQTKIQNFADNVILEGNTTLTNEEKLYKFHDWIVDNFYYYSSPSRIYALNSSGRNYDNPYYLLTYEYDINKKVRARSNGYASMLIAFARSEGIPAREVGGYYNKNAREDYLTWGSNITQTTINSRWVQAYVNGKWITIDPLADCYNIYDGVKYTTIQKDELKHIYFNPSVKILSKSHIAFTYYPGSTSVKYLTSSYEKKKITLFLNKTYAKKKNGKKVNSSYKTSSSETWFPKNTNSIGDGLGRAKKIYWNGKNLYGKLDINGFPALEYISVSKNKIDRLNMVNSPKIKYVYAYSNNMKQIYVTGSKTLMLLNAKNNPATYIKYNYGKTKRVAIIKAGTGGTVSSYYQKTNAGKHKHIMYAKPKSGYLFKGWYTNGKRISKSKVITRYKTQSFTYTAKFVKKPKTTYILISIKSQKMWYYKNGKLITSSKVVTGQKGTHDTPKGTYKLLGKARRVYLVGPDYRSYVNYWMLIDRGYQIGLHDATWRWQFGGTIYKYNGSHGCINLPYNVASYLYNKASIGTSVIIK